MTYYSEILKDNPMLHYSINYNNIPLDNNGLLPVVYWPIAPNFGDLLSPWLMNKITGKTVRQAKSGERSYCVIGSILKRANDSSIVWGTGAFGTERRKQINTNAIYLAVRGPLTRSLLTSRKISCPRVYGDPALLTPCFYNTKVNKKYKIGLVVRWSDKHLKNIHIDDDITIIDLKDDNIESVLQRIIECENIVTSSLHGLIISDAFGIPSAWIYSHTPKGGEFKFYDYFLSVNKIRHCQFLEIPKHTNLTANYINNNLTFDNRDIQFNPHSLLEACPLLSKTR